MPSSSIEFERPFQIWIYTVSMRLLLLRSNRTEDQSTRIDVLFTDVVEIHLPTYFYGLAISEVPMSDTVKLATQTTQQKIGGNKIFRVSGRGFVGWVVASTVASHQDEGHHYDESFFQKAFVSLRV